MARVSLSYPFYALQTADVNILNKLFDGESVQLGISSVSFLIDLDERLLAQLLIGQIGMLRVYSTRNSNHLYLCNLLILNALMRPANFG